MNLFISSIYTKKYHKLTLLSDKNYFDIRDFEKKTVMLTKGLRDWILSGRDGIEKLFKWCFGNWTGSGLDKCHFLGSRQDRDKNEKQFYRKKIPESLNTT